MNIDLHINTKKMQSVEHIYKVMVVGDIGTGKTSFVKKLAHDIFSLTCKSTAGVDFGLKVVKVDDETFRLQLWEVAGQEKYGNMTKVYYQGCYGAFVLYDVTRPTTLDGAKAWKNDLVSKIGYVYKGLYKGLYEGCSPIILLANKVDLLEDDDFQKLDLDKFCKDNGFSGWIAVSCKDGVGIDKACDRMINICQSAVIPEIKAVDLNNNENVPSTLGKCVKGNESPKRSDKLINEFLNDAFDILTQNRSKDSEEIVINEFQIFLFTHGLNVDFREAVVGNDGIRNLLADLLEILTKEFVNHHPKFKISKLTHCMVSYSVKKLIHAF